MKRDATVLEDPKNDNESAKTRRKCPYLDTINTQLLDFDFEKICSITLSDQNVYACLVCGKYFKGRGKSTHAFTHSVQASHHVFINLQNDRIFCLPDNYEVVDQSLKSIKDALRPTFTPDVIKTLDQNRVLAQDAFGVSYLPGFIGLNNLKRTDYISVVFVLQNFQRLKKTYHIRLHPRYLILHVKRFTRNNFFVEKNSTIVNFPVKNLEIREYLITNPENPKLEQLNHKSVAEIKELLDQKRISYDALETRSELAIKLQEATVTSTKYNLVANICHDSPLNKGKTTNLNTNPLTEGSYRVHVQNRATEQWYEIQDLHVQETLPQLIGVSETYMLIYERR
ncbi:unnamed protein product [Albugo candida]|uniref:USP domain-containing protein n=1 Tax=Albugo candida TaxID=65357 RepID=A0A024FYQ7_9STRA|nr:unnamed protein product [Albugo candida]|eukprot:CCI39403.1 unnamed protein product [Albugo candida]